MRSGLKRINQLQKQMYQFSTISEGPLLISQTSQNLLEVTLNSPKTLNALDLNMIRILTPHIANWNQENSQIRAIIIQGAGEKAFCAGGDIKSLYEAKVSGDQSKLPILQDFFREEFNLDYALTQMKPVQISLLDGIVMGGGVGISVHSPIRIATEKSVFAMPEAKIGFFTDVGGGFFLSNLRKNIGMYLGLTGARLKAEQLVQTGVANYFVPGNRLEELKQALKDKITGNFTLDQIQSIVNDYSVKVNPEYSNENEIQRLFQGNKYSDILANFNTEKTEFSEKTLKLLLDQNPLSSRVIFEQIYRAKRDSLSLKDALIIDYRLAMRFMEGSDFFEGVRTVLVDRKDIPKWTYKNALDVPDSEVERYFSPLSNIPELNI